jgi:hypothetical protein
MAINPRPRVRAGDVRPVTSVIAVIVSIRCQFLIGNDKEIDRLAPDLQERLLLLNRIVGGRDVLSLRRLQAIALESDWRKHRINWTDSIALTTEL